MKNFGNFNAKAFFRCRRLCKKLGPISRGGKLKTLIQHALSLEPHRLKDTLSLNRVRSMLETMNEPLGALMSKDSDSNLQEIKKSREIVMAGVADVSSYVDKLTYEKKHHVAVALDR
jgi:hypothetical protein